MLAVLPAAVAPAFADIPAPVAPSADPVELRGFITPEGRVYLATFYPDRAQLPHLESRDHVCRQDGGRGALLLTDVTNLAPEHERPQSGPSVPFSSRPFTMMGAGLRIEFRPDGTPSASPDALFQIRGETGGMFVLHREESPERKAALAKWHAGDHSPEVIDDLIRL